MASGDLSCTNITTDVQGAQALISFLNTANATDKMHVIPSANGRQVCLGKLVREP